MKRKKLNELKHTIRAKGEKATDLDIIVSQLLLLPPGQLKKLLMDLTD